MSSEGKSYPAPLATHEQVVAQPSLFWSTLRSFHSSFGTKFMVPVIGGRELDLHLLYVEVTRRGGYSKVVLEKKWREISLLYHFTPTTTSAAYVLKKHYRSLLGHYEGCYFFKLEAPVSAPTGAGPMSFLAVGKINAKFDCGYMVSMKIGTQVLCGVLYHPQVPAPSTPDVGDQGLAIVPYNPKAAKAQRRRFKKKRWGGDPNHPKPNRSGYNFFFAERHAMLKPLHPNKERELTKMIGQAWNNLDPTEKMVYKKISLEDKERYQREMKEYKESKLRQAQAMPETA